MNKLITLSGLTAIFLLCKIKKLSLFCLNRHLSLKERNKVLLIIPFCLNRHLSLKSKGKK